MGSDTMRKEARKRKFGADTLGQPQTPGSQFEDNGPVADEPPTRKNKQATQTPTSPQVSTVKDDETSFIPIATVATAEDRNLAPAKVQRFIVFIGNLPYTTTNDYIKKHFAKVQPKSVRHRTEKGGGKSKGFAFLEFEGYDRMKTCLKIFHGSEFDDGISPARKLNVELTVGGGGGNSRDRKSKLREKNDRLNEQRKRRALEEEKQEKKSAKKMSKEQVKAGVHEGKKQDVKINNSPEQRAPVDNGDIHPSRRSRMAT